QPLAYDQLGLIPPRTGNRSTSNAPRNVYRTADDRWVAVSTSARSVAERVLRLVGCADVVDEPWFATGAGRAEHADQLDAAVTAWIAERELTEVLSGFERAQAAAAPVYDIAAVMADPQYAALDTITRVHDDDLGEIRMQNVLFRLSRTPGAIRWTGPSLGEHNAEIYGALGLGERALLRLREQGVV
ncbi:MAG: CoA transferase, partial [Kutzneria sp.]|nr:CoA transferase [Kutzneria sp.]